jgi:hypothetical protein
MTFKLQPSMAENWKRFAEMVLPADAPDIQRSEMRKAFYAGATAILGIMEELTDECTEPTDRDMEMVEAVHRELQDFAAAVGAGQPV